MLSRHSYQKNQTKNVHGLTTLKERYKNEMTFREGRHSQFRCSVVCPEVLIKKKGLWQQDGSWSLHHFAAVASKWHIMSSDSWCVLPSQSHFHLMLPVSLAAVVLNSYLFWLQMSHVACTEVKQKHIYGCSKGSSGTKGIWIRFLAELQTPSVRLWELLSSSFPNFYMIRTILQYLQ